MYQVQKNSEGVQWLGKLKSTTQSDADISVSAVKGQKGLCFAVCFRDKCWQRFKSEYVMFGLEGTRLCMMGSDRINGYKLSDIGNFNRYTKSTNPVLAEWAKNHMGDFKLFYDGENKYFYIDTERRM